MTWRNSRIAVEKVSGSKACGIDERISRYPVPRRSVKRYASSRGYSRQGVFLILADRPTDFTQRLNRFETQQHAKSMRRDRCFTHHRDEFLAKKRDDSAIRSNISAVAEPIYDVDLWQKSSGVIIRDSTLSRTHSQFQIETKINRVR